MTDEVQTEAPSAQQMVRVNRTVDLSVSHGTGRELEPTSSPFLTLTTRLLFHPEAPRVIALVSCKSREGVTTVSRSFQDFLTNQLATRVTLLPAEDCLMRAGRTLATVRNSGIGLVPSDIFLAAKDESDVLLIDCSSLESSPAALVLASHVDGVLLVVEDGRRSAVEIRGAVKSIKSANGVVLGVILNKRRKSLPGWLYSLFSRMR